jgi:uncharacterized protein YqgC (DUF456 family)
MKGGGMYFLLWLIAVVLVVWGIVCLVNRDIWRGIALIVIGLLIGPGGVSLFDLDADGVEDGMRAVAAYIHR